GDLVPLLPAFLPGDLDDRRLGAGQNGGVVQPEALPGRAFGGAEYVVADVLGVDRGDGPAHTVRGELGEHGSPAVRGNVRLRRGHDGAQPGRTHPVDQAVRVLRRQMQQDLARPVQTTGGVPLDLAARPARALIRLPIQRRVVRVHADALDLAVRAQRDQARGRRVGKPYV